MRPEPFALDRDALRQELVKYQQLLTPLDKELKERDDILSFFKSHQNLAALIGLYQSRVAVPDCIKSELEIFGDCACDLAVGDAAKGLFCFVEFEAAERGSIFKQGRKGTSDWASRLEHGFSQIVDWFYLMADQSKTHQFKSFFGTDLADYCGLLVIGRSAFLTADEQHRLRWRSQNTLVNGRPVWIITFDELFGMLRDRVELLVNPVPKRSRKGAKTKPKK